MNTSKSSKKLGTYKEAGEFSFGKSTKAEEESKVVARSFNPPKPYISHSQWWLWGQDPMEYYQQYYIARIDRPTDKMTFGKIFQRAWCDPKYNYAGALLKLGFTGDKARIIKTALGHKALIKPHSDDGTQIWSTEYRVAVTQRHKRARELGLVYPIMGILDGYDGKVIIENKTGIVWDQRRADESTQITWYCILIYVRHGFIPNAIIQSVNSRHGIPTILKTRRNKKHLKEMVEKINSMVAFLRAGDFTQH